MAVRNCGNFSRLLSIALTAGLAVSALPVGARAEKPSIKVGVIAWTDSVPGQAVVNGAMLATEQINAKGGIDGRPIKLIVEDSHASSADAISAFRRLVEEDQAVAVVGSMLSEDALALEPWAARLKEPYLITGAVSDKLTEFVHANYEQRKFIFQPSLNSTYLAQNVCDAAHDVLVNGLHMKTAVVMGEGANWTESFDAVLDKCLPKAGLEVLDNVRFALNTSDFTPIYQKIEALHPNVIISGWGITGVTQTVQWAQQRVPIPIFGQSSQATSTTFWNDTDGATQGIITVTPSSAGVARTPKTLTFMEDYQKQFGVAPAFSGYSTYDAIYALAAAIDRAKSTKADPLVNALESTDMIGTIGRLEFQGPNEKFTHELKYGKDFISWIAIQWQNGEQKCIWPVNQANAEPIFPKWITVKK